MIYSWGPVHWLYVSDQHVHQIRPRSHCPGVRPGAARQFVAGGLGRTRTNHEGIWVCSYIPGSATNQTLLEAKIDHYLSLLCYGLWRYIPSVAPEALRCVSDSRCVPMRHGIHRLLHCQTVVWLARVGATSALHNTPWPSGESPYLYLGHSSCRFTTVSPSGITDHAGRATMMPRNKPALFCTPVRPSEFWLF